MRCIAATGQDGCPFEFPSKRLGSDLYVSLILLFGKKKEPMYPMMTLLLAVSIPLPCCWGLGQANVLGTTPNEEEKARFHSIARLSSHLNLFNGGAACVHDILFGGKNPKDTDLVHAATWSSSSIVSYAQYRGLLL